MWAQFEQARIQSYFNQVQNSAGGFVSIHHHNLIAMFVSFALGVCGGKMQIFYHIHVIINVCLFLILSSFNHFIILII